MSVGSFLAARLEQLGARHVFGVPGDFSLNLLDELLSDGKLNWVGTANELDAAYAADGYARVGRTVGAIVTTFGVGELSAVNGVAGSYAEDVPVVHLVGMPSRKALADRAPLHHTFLDGDFRRFVRIHEEVTAASVVLDVSDPAAQIDAALTTMIAESKPVYIGVPLDIVGAPVAARTLDHAIVAARSNPYALDAFSEAIRARIASAGSVSLLVGHQVHRRALEPLIRTVAALDGVRVATQTGSKALLDEGHPSSVGTYLGQVTRDPATRSAIDEADLLVLVGTVFSDFTTGFFTQRFDPTEAIEIASTYARVGHALYRDVHMGDALEALRELVEARAFPPLKRATACTPTSPSRKWDDTSELTHESFWPEVQRWLTSDMTVVAEAGTAFYGALDLDLPGNSELLGQPVWSSIGFTLPAALGAGLVAPNRRPVLLIGDGSAQLTIAELGPLLSGPSRPVVILLDNDGYTVERLIQSPSAVYQDIPRWDWSQVPTALGVPDCEVSSVQTVGGLRDALASASSASTGVFLHAVLPKMDAPRLLLALTQGISETNRDRH